MIHLGSAEVDALHLGSTEVDAVYLGDEQVWPVDDPTPELFYQWGHADPGLELNPGVQLTLGTVFHVYDDILIHGVRVFGHPGSDPVANRKAHIWELNGTLVDDVLIDENPWTGWKDFLFETPIPRAGLAPGAAGAMVVLSYTAGGGNAVVTGAFAGGGNAELNPFGCWAPSSDFIVGNTGLPGNGRSAYGAADTFPPEPYLDSFWGVDILFTLDT